MFDGVAMHQETAAAEGLRCRRRLKMQYERPVRRGASGWADDGPVTFRDGSDIVDLFHLRIVLAGACARISRGYVRAILVQFAGFLGISPGECVDLIENFLYGHIASAPFDSAASMTCGYPRSRLR